MDATPLQFGIDTFGDVTRTGTGEPTPQWQVIREVVDEAVLADGAGLDFFGLGEHHRADFAVSSPEMVLAAAAAPDHADSARVGRHRAQFGRARTRVSTVRDARCAVERSC